MNIKEIPIDKIMEYENNPRDNDNAIDYVAKSIEEFGFKVPIIVDKNNVIIAGHTRVRASKKLGMKKIPCVIADDLTPEQIKAFRLADNKVSEYSTWNEEKLYNELLELKVIDFNIESFGFSTQDIDTSESDTELIMRKFENDDAYINNEIVEDEVPNIPEEPKAKYGDIYILGNHRLMCGDSTSDEDVNKLVGEQKMDLLITDPPYNVNYEGGTRDKMKIKNDNMENNEFYNFLVSVFKNAYNVLKDGASFYCWYASREVVNFHTSIEQCGFTVKQELIWNKNSLVLGRQDYQWKHEPCLYGWKETNSHFWYGDRKQTTVIDWDRPTKSDLHPTMKPVGLFNYQIKNSSKAGDNILDLFGGSGTTIMACEQNNRNAYVMEFDTKYVDVIIERWEKFTGKKAILLNREVI